MISIGISTRTQEPNLKDLYKKNGRVKHECHIIEQGDFQCIRIDSYQAYDKHDGPQTAGAYEDGGDSHFDVSVYRNVGRFKDQSQSSHWKLSYPEIDAQLRKEPSCEVFRLPSEVSKDMVVNEFLGLVGGHVAPEQAVSSIETHANGVRLMSSAYESLVHHKSRRWEELKTWTHWAPLDKDLGVYMSSRR